MTDARALRLVVFGPAMEASHRQPQPADGTQPLTPETITVIGRAYDRTDEVVGVIIAKDREIPGYDSIPDEALRSFIVDAVRDAVQLLRDPGALSEEHVARAHEHARSRAEHGVPVASFLYAAQLGARQFLTLFDDEARRAELPGEAMLEVHDRLWTLANILIGQIGEAYRQVEVEQAHVTERRRIEFVRTVLSGRVDPGYVQARASRFGLDPAAQHRVLLLAPGDQVDPALEHQLRRACGGSPACIVTLDGELVAITPGLPDWPEDAPPLAVGRLVGLADTAVSATEARSVHELALRLGMSGRVDAEQLGARALLPAATGIATALHTRHLAPLEAEGRTGDDIAETLRTYLAQDQNVDRAAEALFVHRNTVHHRLRRFREITGLDLRRTDQLVLAWWLLQRPDPR